MNLIFKIDTFLSKEKVYFQPEKGEKPPKGVQVKVGPREGTFYIQSTVLENLTEKKANYFKEKLDSQFAKYKETSTKNLNSRVRIGYSHLNDLIWCYFRRKRGKARRN